MKIIVGIYGRGGQGVITAANILGETALSENQKKHIMIIPTYGPERTGGPVKALVVLSDQPIQDRSSLKKPTHFIIFDKNLWEEAKIDLEDNHKAELIILNCPREKRGGIANFYEELKKRSIDAAFILVEENSVNLNIIMLEHFIRQTKIASLENLRKAIRKVLSKK